VGTNIAVVVIVKVPDQTGSDAQMTSINRPILANLSQTNVNARAHVVPAIVAAYDTSCFDAV